jgi:FdhD protein
MKEIEIVQFKNGKLSPVKDVVEEECLVHLEINSKISFDVIFTPKDIKDFVYGNLFTEGFIRGKEEVLKYNENIKSNLVNVAVKLADFSERMKFMKKNYNIVWTECGSSGEIKRFLDQPKPLESTVKVKAEGILKILEMIKGKTEQFKQTGALHYAFMFNSDIELLNYSYDIGRHNAVDKIVGTQLLNDGEFADKLIFITGRVSSDIILKCLRAKIPMVVSRGAPLDSAIELANKYNVCLIGFLRGRRFNIYSKPDMIIG